MKTYKENDALEHILRLLNTPGASPVFLLPTETVYGLVCAWDDEVARDKIYRMKRRPPEKHLAAFIHDIASLENIVKNIPENARCFAENFCPGPITLIIPDDTGNTFGFRIPDHPFILELLRVYGKPLASTSANLSGSPAALSVAEAMDSLAFKPEIAFDDGIIPSTSKASTVVLINADNSWKILREGPVTEAELRDSIAH